jgi:hypothetical protein
MRTIQIKKSGLVRVAMMAAFTATLAVRAYAIPMCCMAANGHRYCVDSFACSNQGLGGVAACYCTGYYNVGGGVSVWTGCGAVAACGPMDA